MDKSYRLQGFTTKDTFSSDTIYSWEGICLNLFGFLQEDTLFLCHQFCNISYTKQTKIEVADSTRCLSRPQWQNSYFSLISTIHNSLSYFYQLYTIYTVATAKHSSAHKFSHKSTLIQNSSWRMKEYFSVSQVLKNKKFPQCVPSLEAAAWHGHALSELRS